MVLIMGALIAPQISNAQKADNFNNSGLPIPRFISLRNDKVFVRTGPALRYPIKWIFQSKNMPVEVIQEFDTWRQIRDYEGKEGWIHKSLTRGQRFGLIKPNKKNEKDLVVMTKKPEENSKPIALFEKNVIVKLEECNETHCKALKSGYKGWIERKFLYGIYEDEKFD